MILREPLLIILGGINGAGKSTLAREIAEDPPTAHLTFLDPDKIAAEVRRERPELTLNAANFAGLRIVSERTAAMLAARQSFVTETVLATVAHRLLCEKAQAAGWQVRLVYVGLPRVEDSIARVALRVSKGGHAVPEADIHRRWPRTHENLAWFARHADAVDVYANSQWEAPPALVARAVAGQVTLFDADALPAVTTALQPLV